MSEILDAQGRPFQPRETPPEPQTAKLATLRSEFEGHPSRGMTPPKMARILELAEQGDLTAQHELFQDMEEKDGHLFSVMQTRRLALQSLEWDVVPPRKASAKEKADAEYAREAIASMEGFEDVLFDMTDGIGHGFAALELEWEQQGRDNLPLRATHTPQSWFKLSNNPDIGRNELRLRDNSADGAALWPYGWILHVHKARSGYVARAGLFRVMAWPFIFKNFSVRDLAEFLEIYGLPLRVGTYGPAATEKDKATLLKAVVNIGHDAAAIIPEGMLIDFQSAAEGDEKGFAFMVDLMERTMSKAALGGTLTSGEGTHGTQALGNVHNELRHDIKRSDAGQMGSTLTAQLVYPILAINRGLVDRRRCPRLVFDTQEPDDIKQFSDAVPKLVGMGMRIKKSWAHEKLKIPEADEGEDVLELARPEMTMPPEERPPQGKSAGPEPSKTRPGNKPAKAENRAGPVGIEKDGSDELDALGAEMLSQWADGMGELVAPVQDALDNSSTFGEFALALEQALADANPELVELLAQGTFAARIWGQVNQVKRPEK